MRGAAIAAVVLAVAPACMYIALGADVVDPATAGVELLSIPSGTFMMGCADGDTECGEDEKPPQQVSVSAFMLGKTEVTAAAYEKCVDAGACIPAFTDAENPGLLGRCNYPARHDHPINCVDWEQSVAFCAWIGGRLPTAEEWEYAAKGGENRIYPWGNDPPTAALANFKSAATLAVGRHPAGASKWGLLDMAGNVEEWTATDYDSSALRSMKELRGGSWDLWAKAVRASNHNGIEPTVWKSGIGFRCAQ